MPAKRKISVSASSDTAHTAETRTPRPKRACTLTTQAPPEDHSPLDLSARGFCGEETDEEWPSDSEFEGPEDKPDASGLKKSTKPKKLKKKRGLTDEEKAMRKAMNEVAKLSPVPAPPVVETKLLNSKRDEKRDLNHFQNRMSFWDENAPVYSIKDANLDDLQSRPKSKEARNKAYKTAKGMENEPADAGSMIVTDQAGKKLVCVFACRKGPASKRPLKSLVAERQARLAGRGNPVYPGPEGRTMEDYAKLGPLGKDRFHDGIPPKILGNYHHAVQQLHSILEPKAHSRDIRHPNDLVMEYGHAETEQKTLERTGVTHLVHAWHAQGHSNDPMTPSADMGGRGCGARAIAVVRYLEASNQTARLLAAMFKVAYPEYYEKYKAAFQKGKWRAEDPGPWLGRAIVWKLQVEFHRDGLDDGPAAIFSCGSFEGGELYLPDLRLKLHYAPGDVVIFMAGALYHAVSPWKPALKRDSDILTPGRIGNVFFFPKASYKTLVEKKN